MVIALVDQIDLFLLFRVIHARAQSIDQEQVFLRSDRPGRDNRKVCRLLTANSQIDGREELAVCFRESVPALFRSLQDVHVRSLSKIPEPDLPKLATACWNGALLIECSIRH